MAVKDVKNYYNKMFLQYIEMKADLEDYSAGLEAGYITEEQLQAAIENIRIVEQNYQRLTYIMYLLELPKRDSRKPKVRKANQKLEHAFNYFNADLDSVMTENKSALDNFRAELKKLSINKEFNKEEV